MIVKEEGLKRSIGVIGLSANIINIIIGSGIFALPAIIYAYMGASSIIAYLVCGFLMALIMLCFAEAGSKVTNSGGAYTYIETAFGDYAGFIGGVLSIASFLFADAAVTNALVNAITSAFPEFGSDWLRFSVLFVLFFGLASINVIGLKQGLGLVKFNTVAKLIPLLILIVFGFSHISTSNLQFHEMPSIKTIGETSLILFFAFQGCENGIIVGGEVIDPRRTIPKAIFISIITVLIIYILIQTVSQGVLGAALPNFKSAPLAETAKVVLGTFGFGLLTVGACISMFGNTSGSILNNPRLVYALSRDKVVPIKALSKVHRKFATPYFAIIIYAFIGFILAITGSFEQLIIISSCGMLLIYLGVALSVMKLRKIMKPEPGEFKIPGGYIVPILSIIIILYFLSQLASNEMIGTLVFIVVLTLAYGLIKTLRNKHL